MKVLWPLIRCAAPTALVVGVLLSPLAASGAGPEVASPGAAHAIVHDSIRGRSGGGIPFPANTRTTKTTNGISYHGGAVMNSGTNVYIIWYGSWSGNTATTILPTLISGLSGSAYFNINTTYSDSSNRKVPNSVTLAGQTTDAYSQGAVNLSDNQINAIVTSAITTNSLPRDANGLYFVLTSQDVTKSGFLTSYCGWHTHGSISGTDVKYSFVGNPGTNGACSMQTTSSPNGNVGADAMASVVAHELEETATDPDLNAWYDTRGMENADKCAWTFGATATAANGSHYNMTLGGTQFLIQRNWVNATGGYCSLSF